MKYEIEDFKMTGYKVLHPAISLFESLIVLAQIVFVLLVLEWAWITSTENHAFFVLVLSVVVLFGFSKSIK